LVEFRLLGLLEVVTAEGPVQIVRGRESALLALLLLHRNEPLGSDKIVDELWGDTAPRHAHQSVRIHVSRLRKSLGAERIATRGGGYLIRVADDELDTATFEQLVSAGAAALAGGEAERAALMLGDALGLWHGEALADFRFDSFAQQAIRRLEALRARAREDRVDARIALGRARDVVPELEEMIVESPLSERPRSQLMRALYLSGRQADALELFRQTRTFLAAELGVEPGPELQHVERAILIQDPSLGTPAAAPSVVAGRRRLRLLNRRRGARRWIAGGAVLIGAIAASLLLLGNGSNAVAVGANSVAVIDPRTNQVVGDVPVGSGPDAVAVGARGVWVANGGDGTVTRIDPWTRKVVSTVGIGADVSDVAVGYGSVWVADGNDGTLTRIDPSQNAVRATFLLGPSNDLSPQPLYSVTTGDHEVWVTRGDRLLRIDPVSGRVTLRVRLEPPLGLAESGGIVWVTTTVDHIVELAARTGGLTGMFSIPDRGIAPVLTRGFLWMIVGNPGEAPRATKIWQVDPNTGSTTATAPQPFAVDLTAGAHALWVACSNGTVQRIDPTTGQATRTVRIGQQPSAVGFGAGLLWVAVQSATQ
jgi:YVTN family beta-propeller protein